MRMNVYDRQLIGDHRILRSIGLMLQREENVARPVAAQSGCSTNQDNTPLTRCAWCDREAGVTIKPGDALVSHGICPKHHAGIKANLEELRRIAA